MNCDTYCEGKSTEVTCSSVSGADKEKCIKSCLDCRSPNKKFCYCPSIFPPKVGKGGRQRVDGEDTRKINELLEAEGEKDTNVLAYVIAAFLIIILCILCCLCVYWWTLKSRKRAKEKGQPAYAAVTSVGQGQTRDPGMSPYVGYDYDRPKKHRHRHRHHHRHRRDEEEEEEAPKSRPMPPPLTESALEAAVAEGREEDDEKTECDDACCWCEDCTESRLAVQYQMCKS